MIIYISDRSFKLFFKGSNSKPFTSERISEYLFHVIGYFYLWLIDYLFKLSITYM